MSSLPTNNPENDKLTFADRMRYNFSDKKHIRILVSFWILGICNNYGYVVMLSAANDILYDEDDERNNNNNSNVNSTNYRACNFMSTGTILLADILPSLCTKLLSPFIPFFIHIRMALVIFIGAAGYAFVAYGGAIKARRWISISGVVVTSISCGLGESTLLQYSAKYHKNVLSSWSSGTGAAGIAASVTYASIVLAFGIKTTIFVMMIVPALMGITFWIMLPFPASNSDVSPDADAADHLSFKKKLSLIPGLLKFMIPLGTVYLFEYFINQGLFELIQFEDIFLDVYSQYRWLSVDYQIGVFVSRSSVNILHIRNLWILSVLQFVNVIMFTTEAIYSYTPYFWIILLLTFWEGLLGGASYVNTFYTISTDINEEDKPSSLAITSFSDSIGIALAGVFAIEVHNSICKLPKAERFLVS